ncbi:MULTISPECIES: hypothetical protein [Roseivirga]|jgi:L-asparagine transporter-like permease|uniref:Uncharacterized protein n=1 Tax=Roseivirga thermotolerans TaxID=1758176 RepID=A0ABQ3I118_9BACT|nr:MULTISPECIES: hypothetical protein [Roseivirga]MEC7752820.1 hypothetical protein [Bacteroidota bacterium]GHE54308.1 hypothetical protein GCM10011340_06130 [Roseivirga thermotolerans]|tara:strand:- start:3967 stop:4329 length:363 start_codon:yes stop_codon:yes gene_type:complete
MKTIEKIEQRIEELRWKSISPYQRIIMNKEKIQTERFHSKEKERELKWYLRSNSVLLLILAIVIVLVSMFRTVTTDFTLFMLFITTLFVAQRIELQQRLNNLKESRFLKKILQDLNTDKK